MHCHLEVIMPPVDDIYEALIDILDPFNEDPEDGHPSKDAFWDWWVIGGRRSGVKLEDTLDPKKKAAFLAELENRNVTVKDVRVGKQRLWPESQIPMVDELWRQFFTESPLKICPFFEHFDTQHTEDYPDIMQLRDMPKSLKAAHVIIAGPSGSNDGKLEMKRMMQKSYWKDTEYVDSVWDGSVQYVIDQYNEYLKGTEPEYAAKQTPRDDWLVVTVDYHS